MSIAFKCSCGRGLRANPEMAGKKTKCPGCGSILTIPAAGDAAPPAAAPKPAPAVAPAAAAPAAMVTCECGTKIRTKPEWAGKVIKCPKCEAKIKVPAAAAAPVAAAPVAAAPRPAPKPAPPPPMDDEPFAGGNFSEEPFGNGDFAAPGSFQDDPAAEAVDDEPVPSRRKAAAAAAPPAKKKGSGMLLYILLLLLLLGGGGFAAWAFFFNDPATTVPGIKQPTIPNKTDGKDDDGDDDPDEMSGKKDKEKGKEKASGKKKVDDDDPKVDEPKDDPKKDDVKDDKDDQPKAEVQPKKLAVAPAPAVAGGQAFQFVSGKVQGFLSLRPQALTKTAAGQKILAMMEEGKDGKDYKAVTEAFGVGIGDITHVLIVLPDVPDMSKQNVVPGLFIIETEKPIQEAGLENFAESKVLEKKSTKDGKTYYWLSAQKGANKGAVALLAPNVAVIGKDSEVIALMAGKKAPLDAVIAPMVQSAAKGNQVVFAGFQVPAQMADAALKGAPPPVQEMGAPFAATRSGQFSIAAADSLKVSLKLNFDDPDKAAKAKETVDALLNMAGEALPIAKKTTPPEFGKFADIGEAALKSIEPAAAGNSLEVPIEIKVSLDELGDLVLPIVLKQMEASKRLISQNNLRQLALAMHSYHDTYRSLPTAKIGKEGLSWRVAILPFVEAAALAKMVKTDEAWDSEDNMKLLAMMPPVFKHPTRPAEEGYTYYRVVIGPQTIFLDGTKKNSLARIQDGTSNTFMIVEAETAVPWTKFEELEFDPKGPLPKLGEGGRFSAAFADGSVQSFANLSEKDLAAFITASGGEVVDRAGGAEASDPADLGIETKVEKKIPESKKDLKTPKKIGEPKNEFLPKFGDGARLDGAMLDRPVVIAVSNCVPIAARRELRLTAI